MAITSLSYRFKRQWNTHSVGCCTLFGRHHRLILSFWPNICTNILIITSSLERYDAAAGSFSPTAWFCAVVDHRSLSTCFQVPLTLRTFRTSRQQHLFGPFFIPTCALSGLLHLTREHSQIPVQSMPFLLMGLKKCMYCYIGTNN